MARHIAHAVLALAIVAAATPLARGAHLRASYTPGQPPVEADMDARRWLAHMAHAHGADVSSVPMPAPDDVLSVWAVLAPLSKAKFGNLLGKLNLFHCGIVIENETTGVNTTWEYTATNFGAFFPKVVSDNNGTAEFEWDNGALVVDPHATDMTYWTTYTFMGHITPAAYAQFATTFVLSFNTTFITYNLFSLVQPAAQGPDLPSSTCFDFQFHGLQYLHSLPGTNFAVDTLSRDEVWLMASERHLVNIDTPSVRAKAAAFYGAIDSIPHLFDTNMTKLFKQDLQKVLTKLGDGQPAYYYSTRQRYYAYQPAQPFLQVSFDEVRLWDAASDDDANQRKGASGQGVGAGLRA